MKFRLVYRGPLPAASNSNKRSEEKHAVRRVLHPQLREMYRAHPAFKGYALDLTADSLAAFGFRWVPLIQKDWGIACALDILFLRREVPGTPGLVRGGDIDNRIKTLLDALRKPGSLEEVGNASPKEGEDPFFVLLEDDYYITELKVTTDRLLVPDADKSRENDVHMIIGVKVIVTDPAKAIYEFHG